MLLIDFNGVAVANIMAMKGQDMNEDLIRHTILNSIRMYNLKYRHEYGEVVIACEGRSWRKDVFPQYKANRGKSRDDSKVDWGFIFECINKVKEEIKANFHYKVVQVGTAEADDIIGTLVEYTQEFGQHQDVMIISADKDFVQLQKYGNVKQFSPYTKKLVTEKNPRAYLLEHIFKGDSGDGVPNVLSGDNYLVDGIRQSPVTKKKIEAWMDNIDSLDTIMDQDTYRNFQRNKRMIDLSETPSSVKEEIINTYESIKVAPKMKILNYLIKNRCRLLVESVADFH